MVPSSVCEGDEVMGIHRVLILSCIGSVCMGYSKFRRTVLHNRGCWSCDGAVELCRPSRSSRIEEGKISIYR